MNGETKSSPRGYHKLLEFSYNVIIDTHKCKSDYYHHQAESSHFFLSLPSPKVQVLYKKMQKKCCKIECLRRPLAAAAARRK